MSSEKLRQAPIDPLLVGAGEQALLLGNEAIVRGALEAGVGFASGYPGTPSSEVTDTFARLSKAHGIVFEYSVNEKIALEMAYAASLGGARSICAMKHLGLLVAGDPLSTITYMGVRGGMVIVSAGDPSCHTSPNEQDQRHLGPMLHVPVLDPSTPADALAMTRMAFELSEKSLLPVLLRITARVAHCRAPITFGELAPIEISGFKRDPSRFVPIPAHARKLRSQIPARLDIARGFMDELFSCEDDTQDAAEFTVVATGSAAATCRDVIAAHQLESRVRFAEVPGVFPLPTEPLLKLLRKAERVLVVEELSPFLEDQLSVLAKANGLRCEILGKRSGHLPEPFEYTPEIIQEGLRSAFELTTEIATVAEPEPLPGRPPVLCAGCPHRSTYFAARSAFPEDQLYFNDIGCYTLGFAPPLATADALLCMGAGFTLAAGVARVTGERTVGFMGDGTFFHAGMPALLNVIKEDVNMVAVILDNQVTAMTGFQESATVTNEGPTPQRAISIEGVVRALGAEQVVTVDPEKLPLAVAAFERARERKGLSVIIAEHPCPVHMARAHGAPEEQASFTIDQTSCQTCARDACGMRCEQPTTIGLERHMAKSRSLEVLQGPATQSAASCSSMTKAAAPCGGQCPLGLCIQGYTGHIASGQYAGALELIMSRNPLPDSVCRVCHRPCESVCVRGQLDEPVAINDLKRFVMDWAARSSSDAYQPTAEPDNGMAVAVIGAGPAGLAASHDLRLRGYQVTLYDGAEKAGGMLRTGVPAFRLPDEALDRDLARIFELGVKFEGNRWLGRDLGLQALLDESFDAVLVATGAGEGLELSWGDNAPKRIEGALGYLAGARTGETPAAGQNVVVIGGGNAALDAARTAIRSGAKTVSVICREGQDDLPALRDEIDGALQEGIIIHAGLSPDLPALDDHSLTFFPVRAEPTKPGAAPRFIAAAGPKRTFETDHVIVAIGQAPDAMGSDDAIDLARHKDGTLVVDAHTGQTSHAKIFAGGDAVPGPRTVTDAIADGQRAAWGIDVSLRSRELADKKAPPLRPDEWTLGGAPAGQPPQRNDGQQRQRPAQLEMAARNASFSEIESTLSEEQARAEAARCMVCGQCGNCRACIDLFGCPAFHMEGELIAIDPKVCTSCGMCADFCPNGAIHQLPPVADSPDSPDSPDNPSDAQETN